MKLQYKATALNGTLKMVNRQSLIKDLENLEGKHLIVTIEKATKSRSNAQNRYYWGCVIQIIKDGLIDAGFDRTIFQNSEAVHELIKSMFCPKREVISEHGEVLQIAPTTTELTTVEFMNYMDDIKQWSIEFLGIDIPDPGQQVEINY